MDRRLHGSDTPPASSPVWGVLVRLGDTEARQDTAGTAATGTNLWFVRQR